MSGVINMLVHYLHAMGQIRHIETELYMPAEAKCGIITMGFSIAN
ncbi:16566_t:CDS:2 [Funneliformis mosseae]|uniref:16566_t:CDS:1 n=1 Tax=Funneliformis mosseae TaxID=27381 RepID=A0A9N8Z3U6_FUNMO|nr:16566_t:CDS:2 [Funneliformis mosseae]